MFTGIIEELGRVALVNPDGLVISASRVLEAMEPGGSINVNGACLTVTSLDDSSFSVDVMPETLERTNLGRLAVGDEVNLEPPLALGGRLGGHLVQGHVDATGRISSIRRHKGAMLVEFEAPAQVMAYIVDKGFIAVDGVSLTVTAGGEGLFRASVVDFTRRHTNLGRRRLGDLVNLEVDIIAKYVAKFTQKGHSAITVDFLQEHGFLVS